METQIIRENSTITVTIVGRLDTTNSKEFELQLQPLMVEKTPSIVLNCKEMRYISSSGLRIFLTLLKSVKANGGSLVIEHMDAEVKKVFDMTGFSDLFTIQ